MNRPRLLTLATAVLAVLALATPAAANRSDVRRARALLRGHMFTHFTQSGVLGSSFDQRLHLCSNGRFIYDTVSYLPEAGTTNVNRTTGRWRVTRAHIARDRRSGRARVRGVPGDGSRPITVTIRVSRRGRTTIDGALVAVDRSDLCR
jgi:hypothetical protein